MNADIPAIEKAIQASGSKVRTHSFFFPFWEVGSLKIKSHVGSQSFTLVFVLPSLVSLKNLVSQVKMSGEDLKACVLEIQEVLVN